MMRPSAHTALRPAFRIAFRTALGVAAMTLLFAAQDAARRATAGMPMSWPQSLLAYGIDWSVWGALAWLMASVARHFRVDRGNRARRLLLWLVLGVVLCVVQSVLDGIALRAFALDGTLGPTMHQRPIGTLLLLMTTASLAPNLLIFAMIAGALHAALYQRDLRDREQRSQALETRLARAELDALRQQIQPHFFFNALNTVSSLMESDVPRARTVLAALGDLMRSSLDHSARHEIALRDELAFIERYLAIQRERFRSRLQIDIDVDHAALDTLVPSMILQPAVENAIRHGIEPYSRPGHVWITARLSGADVVLSVRDDGLVAHETPGDVRHAAPGQGIGLQNVAARLTHLYGDAHRFDAGRRADGHYTVELRMPARSAATV